MTAVFAHRGFTEIGGGHAGVGGDTRDRDVQRRERLEVRLMFPDLGGGQPPGADAVRGSS